MPQKNVALSIQSLMDDESCIAPDLKIHLSGVDTKSKPQEKKKPVVYSETILKFCEALGLEAQLAACTERKFLLPRDKKETKQMRYIPTVRSLMVYKTCEALGLRAELNTQMESVAILDQ
ncbi:hypothetical protein NPIL_317851 [Nephila pilipes]|uniref:Uncharacterized protein n=1 Tax=Nephila pilipes TaxID=299642 RepID=A0A8X6QLF1_NEPPI|nr:hypothetical protein NPIL_317851 [Nephila pilipes]